MARLFGSFFLLALCGCTLDRNGDIGSGGSPDGAGSTAADTGASTSGGAGPGTTGVTATSVSASSGPSEGGGGSGTDVVSVASTGTTASSSAVSSGSGETGGGGGDAPVSVCGNQVVESGEQCDDGNAAPGDRCDPSCVEEHPDSCPGTPIRLEAGATLIIRDTTEGADDTLQDTQNRGCPTGNAWPGADLIYAVTPAAGGTLSAHLEATFDNHYLVLRTSCPSTGTDILRCDGDEDADQDDSISEEVAGGTVYYLQVDSYGETFGAFELEIDLQD